MTSTYGSADVTDGCGGQLFAVLALGALLRIGCSTDGDGFTRINSAGIINEISGRNLGEHARSPGGRLVRQETSVRLGRCSVANQAAINLRPSLHQTVAR